MKHKSDGFGTEWVRFPLHPLGDKLKYSYKKQDRYSFLLKSKPGFSL